MDIALISLAGLLAVGEEGHLVDGGAWWPQLWLEVAAGGTLRVPSGLSWEARPSWSCSALPAALRCACCLVSGQAAAPCAALMVIQEGVGAGVRLSSAGSSEGHVWPCSGQMAVCSRGQGFGAALWLAWLSSWCLLGPLPRAASRKCAPSRHPSVWSCWPGCAPQPESHAARVWLLSGEGWVVGLVGSTARAQQKCLDAC